MNLFTKSAATVIAAAAILGAGAGVASAATAPAATGHVAVQSGSPMVYQQIVFTNNTNHDLMINDVRGEDTAGHQGCHWGPGLPATSTHITPGESFIASVMFETFQDTMCDFAVNSIDNSTGEVTDNNSWINMDVNAIDVLTPSIVNDGLGTHLTFNPATTELTAVSYVDPTN